MLEEDIVNSEIDMAPSAGNHSQLVQDNLGVPIVTDQQLHVDETPADYNRQKEMALQAVINAIHNRGGGKEKEKEKKKSKRKNRLEHFSWSVSILKYNKVKIRNRMNLNAAAAAAESAAS